MVHNEDVKEDIYDMAIPYTMFTEVVYAHMASFKVLSFADVLGTKSTSQLAHFMVVHGLTMDPINIIQDRVGSCLRLDTGNIVRVQHTTQMCRVVPMQTLELPTRITIPGLHTFVVDIVANSRFRMRFKRQNWPGEVGSKHVCMIDARMRHFLMAGEVFVSVDGVCTVNLQSGTFMMGHMSSLRSLLIRDGEFEYYPSLLFGLDECLNIWWKPLLCYLFQESTFTSRPFSRPTLTISRDMVDELYQTHPAAFTEFVTMGDCGRSDVFERPYTTGVQPSIVDHLMSYINTIPDIHVTTLIGHGRHHTIFDGTFGIIPCAFKVATSAISRLNLQRELVNLTRIGMHPYIVKQIVHRYIRKPPLGILVFRTYPFTLTSYIKKAPPSECVSIVCRMVGHICSALEACHNAGYIHLNISATNILCDHQDTFVLSDFGMMYKCTTSDRFGDKHQTNTYYESPLIRQEEFQTYRVDWHSLVFIVYHIIYGALLWETMSPESSVSYKTRLLNDVRTDMLLTNNSKLRILFDLL